MLVIPDTYSDAMQHLNNCTVLTVDTETTGLMPWRDDKLCGIAIRGGGRSYYFPFRHLTNNLCMSKLGDMADLLTKPDVTYIGFNYGFDIEFMYQDGIKYPPRLEDVQTMAHLLNENEATKTLKGLADKYLDSESSAEDKKLSSRLKELKLKKNEMWKLHPAEVAPYACSDVDLTEGLHTFYLPYLHSWKLYDLWQEVNEYQLALCCMERHGVQLDLELMEEYIVRAQVEKEQARQVIEKLAGYEINLNSAPQLQKWLKLSSTAAVVLAKKPNLPGVKELLTYRGWNRVYANYYRKFKETMDSSGRLHANLNIVGTETGRLSCSNPPLQAIPRTTDVYKVKDVFVANEGMVLLEADYSQAEVRVASHYGNVRLMKEKLARDGDIHTETANEIGIPRDAAKRLNFSVIYGIGPAKLADNLGVSVKQAKEYLNKYHSRYPGFKKLYATAEAKAVHRGYIRMHTGRLRHYNTKYAFPHKASSNLVQGTVGEMLRVAITRIHKEIKHPMWLTVHDSVLFEIPREEIQTAIVDIQEIMLDTSWCVVPMKVDIKYGKSWGKTTSNGESK